MCALGPHALPTQVHTTPPSPVAVFRASVQVLLLGLLLAPVMHYRHWSVLLAACGAMLALASAEAASRPRYSYQARHLVANVDSAGVDRCEQCRGCYGAGSEGVFLEDLLLCLECWGSPGACRVYMKNSPMCISRRHHHRSWD